MYELERWNTNYYPSYWEYVDTFKTAEAAVKEAYLQQYSEWRVITTVVES